MKKSNQTVNAVIMAAGTSSRFAPISYEIPKGLLVVKGEVLIERQIEQLRAANISDITIVVGYKKEMFTYLKEKYQVTIIENPEFASRNNHASLYYAQDKIRNTYICSADNYFLKNVFLEEVNKPYYASVYQAGETNEWCLNYNTNGLINKVTVGGQDTWVMLGQIYFNEEFSEKFLSILNQVYARPETKDKLWEEIYVDNLASLDLYIKQYQNDVIFEFDTLDELRSFDESYQNNASSEILNLVTAKLHCEQFEITSYLPIYQNGLVIGFSFTYKDLRYGFYYTSQQLERI